MYKNILIRCLLNCSVVMIDFYVIKYISLAFRGVLKGLTPVVTMVFSWLIIGEKFKSHEIVFLFISLIGVSSVTIGFIIDGQQDN